METLMQLGIGGIFAVLVIREVLSFLQRREGVAPVNAPLDPLAHVECLTPEERKMLRQLHEWARDLHVWHDVTDDDGVKIWYVRRSLEDSVNRLSLTIEKLSEFQRAELEVLKEMARDMREMRNKGSLQ